MKSGICCEAGWCKWIRENVIGLHSIFYSLLQGKGKSTTDKRTDDEKASTSLVDQEPKDSFYPEKQIDNFDELSLDEKQTGS